MTATNSKTRRPIVTSSVPALGMEITRTVWASGPAQIELGINGVHALGAFRESATAAWNLPDALHLPNDATPETLLGLSVALREFCASMEGK